MKVLTLTTAIALTALCMLSTSALAYPTVTVPTATMIPRGTLSANYYSVDTRATNPYAPDSMSITSAYIGVTDTFELDVNYIKPESIGGKTSFTGQYLAVAETRKYPAVALGAEDLTQENGDTSIYIALAKTVSPIRGRTPSYPIVRLNLGYGTEPRSAIFGGLQLRVTPELGVVALSDGHDDVFAVSYSVAKTGLMLKAGTLGRARFLGLEYRLPLR